MKPRIRSVSAGARLHGVPDALVAAGLAASLEQHICADWYAVVMFSDGRGVAMPAHDGVALPPEAVMRWMAEVAAALNHELHSGGHWIVAWSDAGEPVLLWRDGNVALRLVVEVSATAEALPDHGVERVVQLATQALLEMHKRQ